MGKIKLKKLLVGGVVGGLIGALIPCMIFLAALLKCKAKYMPGCGDIGFALGAIIIGSAFLFIVGTIIGIVIVTLRKWKIEFI